MYDLNINIYIEGNGNDDERSRFVRRRRIIIIKKQYGSDRHVFFLYKYLCIYLFTIRYSHCRRNNIYERQRRLGRIRIRPRTYRVVQNSHFSIRIRSQILINK